MSKHIVEFTIPSIHGGEEEITYYLYSDGTYRTSNFNYTDRSMYKISEEGRFMYSHNKGGTWFTYSTERSVTIVNEIVAQGLLDG